ncbi:unnamed protein product, partial [Owenia fusiformis]
GTHNIPNNGGVYQGMPVQQSQLGYMGPQANPIPQMSHNQFIQPGIGPINTQRGHFPINQLNTNGSTQGTLVQVPNSGATGLQNTLYNGIPIGPRILTGMGNPSQFSWSAPLDSHLNEATKQKIISEEYIDFKTLLPASVKKKKKKPAFQFEQKQQDDGESMLIIAPEKDDQDLSYKEWQQAFNIFCTTYIRQHSHEAANLIKYGDKIRELSNNPESNWRYYGERFRENKKHGLQWHTWYNDFMLEATWVHRVPRQVQGKWKPNGKGQNGKNNSFRAICNQWNSGKFCPHSTCPRSHICSSCKGDHRVTDCNNKKEENGWGNRSKFDNKRKNKTQPFKRN